MIYELSSELRFPDVRWAENDGLLAYGGDLSSERILLGYRSGIFPWYDRNPVLWWSPDPRFVLFPEEVNISRSMRKIIERKVFHITVDTAFEQVITNCATVIRNGQAKTWITDEMINAYCTLNKEGYAHSFEAWSDDKLVGGLYGISLGSVFFGESMFTHVSNASKAAFLQMILFLRSQGFTLIDSQVHTRHVESLGGKNIPRSTYLNLLDEGLLVNDLHGSWTERYNSVTSSRTTVRATDPR
ncbi:MAG: leucyl/phenylalanyl-tRNA--protein transferase [Spirochaetes bacterium]|jgi:leucyl/phenylalanyl-tRNA--protein transferase|nr:leucyl/phenylalanyl-tRNA--protein transferase [Spirochaetota bacterium]